MIRKDRTARGTRSTGSRSAAFVRSGGRTLVLLALACAGCGGGEVGGPAVVTFPGSAVGAEARVLERQLERFMGERPDIRVVQRRTPDAADQRHQLYVQWLNAGASDPDILQLDVIWTPEFAAAGWILPLDELDPPVEDFFPATADANRWDGRLYALPWFVDVGMLYWRTDLMDEPPATLDEMVRQARDAMAGHDLRYGALWQGARYEGLVTVFLEHLGAFGGAILDESGRVVVDSDAAVRALRFMRDAIYVHRVVPQAVLTWQEEQTRFAFQNGQAAFLRNWPYAYPLMNDDSDSQVAGRFAVAPFPRGSPEGEPTAALGGSQLAINANTENPEAAYAVIEYLTRPEQMLERAHEVGQYPARISLYRDGSLEGVLPAPPDQVERIILSARPRPVTPVYTQLSELLQIRLHRALTGQAAPEDALREAAREMRRLLDKVGLHRRDVARAN